MYSYQKKSVVLFIVLFLVQVFSLYKIMSRGNHDFIINIILTTTFWCIYVLIELIKKLNIHLYIQIVAAITIIGDGFFGLYMNLYSLSPLYDRIQHIFGAYALALFFYSFIARLMKTTISLKWIRVIFIFAIGLSLGALCEILEYAADTFMKPQILNQPSLEDTDLDLVSDLIGACIAGIHSFYVDFGQKKN